MLTGKNLKGERPLRRPKCKWEKNIKINIREIRRRLDLSGPDEHSNCRTRAKKDWTVVDSLNAHEFLKAKCFQWT
jgi:hypothetical protein